jgi:hypothetical protein
VVLPRGYARQHPGFQVGFASDEWDFMLKLIRKTKTPKEPVPRPQATPKLLIDLVTPEEEKQMVEMLRRDWWSFEEIGFKFNYSDSVVRKIAERNGPGEATEEVEPEQEVNKTPCPWTPLRGQGCKEILCCVACYVIRFVGTNPVTTGLVVIKMFWPNLISVRARIHDSNSGMGIKSRHYCFRFKQTLVLVSRSRFRRNQHRTKNLRRVSVNDTVHENGCSILVARSYVSFDPTVARFFDGVLITVLPRIVHGILGMLLHKVPDC